ncbi:MAG: UDP-N-acetylbacillosamine N-acetyltransferase [Crocinitomix sp.]|jgi:UDP-N-acetylbacillosamine N-acetyltransferase
MKNLIIIGTGGHARPVVDIAQSLPAFQSSQLDVACIDTNYSGKDEDILGIPVIGGMDKLNTYSNTDTSIFVAVGDNLERKQIVTEVQALGYEISTLIHPTAIISAHSKIGNGSLVCAGAILNPGVEIGEGCIINTGAIIDHETIIGDFAHIAPGVKIAGRAKIGELAFIGIGSVIIDKIKIGAYATVGAASVILDHVSENATVVGLHKKMK